jgi:hypothetical protein
MVKRPVVKNKKNNQLMITIPRKAYAFLEGKNPKSVNLKLKKEDFEF